MHIILTHFFELREKQLEINSDNGSRVSVIEQSKHEATSDLSEIISRTKKFYYRNDSGDLIKVTGGNSDCLVATQVSITSVSAALEACFNNVADGTLSKIDRVSMAKIVESMTDRKIEDIQDAIYSVLGNAKKSSIDESNNKDNGN
ncbi:hypothetical protein IPC65_24110 [Pseudomonas aeruginosa]|uniref:hypothetical protein n=1 Tax=Pseudomonas aeruginosa TaxID=287 RepID=UPI001068834E|nr:hypothetical protein [Pseudomonas aeruginosa]TEP98105.1 hypothetical protein IPC64_09625 [Pseudomonas aeruginosa]TEQ00639.1 hypothetical protein IPC65_24110 [Pseudomonas aeruginosa]TEQ11013.1 hypothetical protein IPC66_18930 [Pseudomonas aeruginosa]